MLLTSCPSHCNYLPPTLIHPHVLKKTFWNVIYMCGHFALESIKKNQLLSVHGLWDLLFLAQSPETRLTIQHTLFAFPLSLLLCYIFCHLELCCWPMPSVYFNSAHFWKQLKYHLWLSLTWWWHSRRNLCSGVKFPKATCLIFTSHKMEWEKSYLTGILWNQYWAHMNLSFFFFWFLLLYWSNAMFIIFSNNTDIY